MFTVTVLKRNIHYLLMKSVCFTFSMFLLLFCFVILKSFSIILNNIILSLCNRVLLNTSK
jgi:hypothetical protein